MSSWSRDTIESARMCQIFDRWKENAMTIKTMIKIFGPIVLFSIVLPLVDILTDLRLISRFYFFHSCISWDDIKRLKLNISHSEVGECWDYMSKFCQLESTVCVTKYKKYAILLFGERTKNCIKSNLNHIHFSSILAKLYCFIHNMVSNGEEQGPDICTSIAQYIPNLW